jgi:hypothetical protein
MVRGMDYTSIQELELFIEKCYRSGNLAPEDALTCFIAIIWLNRRWAANKMDPKDEYD